MGGRGPRTAVEGGYCLRACLIVTTFHQEQRLLREESEKIVFSEGDLDSIGI